MVCENGWRKKGKINVDSEQISKKEIEKMFQIMFEHMPEDMRNIAIKEFGGIGVNFKHKNTISSKKSKIN